MASALQRLLPWRRKTLTVSGKEPHFQNCTYLGPVPILNAHNSLAALRSAWQRYRESHGSTGNQVSLRIKVNRLEMQFINVDDMKDEEFYLHRIVSCQSSAIKEPTPSAPVPNFDDSDGEREDCQIECESNDGEPVVDTLVAWTYRHEHKRSRIAYKAHVVNFHSTKRAVNFHTALTEKLMFTLEEYRRERIQRQSCRARMVRTRSVESGLQRSGSLNATPLRKTTLSTARHFKPESKAAPKLQILNEEEEEEEEAGDVPNASRRLSRLSLALVD